MLDSACSDVDSIGAKLAEGVVALITLESFARIDPFQAQTNTGCTLAILYTFVNVPLIRKRIKFCHGSSEDVPHHNRRPCPLNLLRACRRISPTLFTQIPLVVEAYEGLSCAG
jgi:hypothetical protein